MSKNEELKHEWDAGLTNEEYCLIGTLVAQWGALESTIFFQTLKTYGPDISPNQLPKEMNNLNFTSVLRLWKKRVVDVSDGDVKSLLQRSYEKILKLKDFRNSIVHGMWTFSKDELKTISTVRAKKGMLHYTVFNDGDLSDFCMKVAQLNWDILYPNGFSQFLQENMRNGWYINEAEMRRMKLESPKK